MKYASGFTHGGFGPFVAHKRQKKLFQAAALGRNELIELFERALRCELSLRLSICYETLETS